MRQNVLCFLGMLVIACSNQTPTSPKPAPEVRTVEATNITSTSVTIQGVITSEDSEASVYFQWGDSSLKERTVTSIVGRTTNRHLEETLRNLTPNTTYYFRLSASGGNERVNGETLSFTTKP